MDVSPDDVGLCAVGTVAVSKSPIERPGSDCWDITVTFLDPGYRRRAKVSHVFVVDVSDELPVRLRITHRFRGAD